MMNKTEAVLQEKVTRLEEDLKDRSVKWHNLNNNMQVYMEDIRQELLTEIREFKRLFFEKMDSLDNKYASKDIEKECHENTNFKFKIVGALTILSFIGMANLILLFLAWTKISQ